MNAPPLLDPKRDALALIEAAERGDDDAMRLLILAHADDALGLISALVTLAVALLSGAEDPQRLLAELRAGLLDAEVDDDE